MNLSPEQLQAAAAFFASQGLLKQQPTTPTKPKKNDYSFLVSGTMWGEDGQPTGHPNNSFMLEDQQPEPQLDVEAFQPVEEREPSFPLADMTDGYKQLLEHCLTNESSSSTITERRPTFIKTEAYIYDRRQRRGD